MSAEPEVLEFGCGPWRNSKFRRNNHKPKYQFIMFSMLRYWKATTTTTIRANYYAAVNTLGHIRRISRKCDSSHNRRRRRVQYFRNDTGRPRRKQQQQQQQPTTTKPFLQVVQYPASSSPSWNAADDENGNKNNNVNDPATTTIYKASSSSAKNTKNHVPSSTWEKVGVAKNFDLATAATAATTSSSPHHHTNTNNTNFFYYYRTLLLQHFLPANYPHSVSPEYATFSIASFVASVAGSAGMVLSTQALLVAVVVGGSGGIGMDMSSSSSSNVATTTTTHTTAAVVAGAWNWVVKDGMGQLGGVLFASTITSNPSSKQLDADPKRWRMVAALSLDAASLLEILSPALVFYLGGSIGTGTGTGIGSNAAVLALACTANVCKNIGFLTASASRAALHQSLATTSNLADVTVKAGSQSVAAGCLGTALGIALSSSSAAAAAAAEPYSFLGAFLGCLLVHQVGTYHSVKAVRLRHLNRQRLYLVCQEYVQSKNARTVLSPRQVAEREVFVPFVRNNNNKKKNNDNDVTGDWLCIGTDLVTLCPGGLQDLLDVWRPGTEEDDPQGQQQAYILKKDNNNNNNKNTGKIHLTFLRHATGEDLVAGMLHATLLSSQHNSSSDTTEEEALFTTRKMMQERFPHFLQAMHDQGWRTGTNETIVEPSGAVRLDIQTKDD